MNTHANNTNPNNSTGPRTPQGKAVSAKNATTHGLYAAQTVLPHLGEDPAAYEAMQHALLDQLRPRNHMERRYIELWLQASWKLQRLTRLEDQAWHNAADSDTDQDALLTRIERLTRLQSALRRQMDKSLHMLTYQLPGLFAQRTREDVLKAMNLTEAILEKYPFRKDEVEKNVQANTYWPDMSNANNKNGQNELPAPVPDSDAVEGELVQQIDAQLVDETQNAQNEPASPRPFPGREGTGGLPPGIGSSEAGSSDWSGSYITDRAHRQRRGIRPRVSASLPPTAINEAEETRQKYEHALNNLSIPWEERQHLMEMIGSERIYDTENGFRIRPI